MKRISLIVLSVLLFSGLMVDAAQAWRPGPYRGWGPPPGIFWRGPFIAGPILFPFFPIPVPVPAPQPVVVQQAPIVVRQPQANAHYWYYCEEPKGYYPYVAECPAGWMKVVPNANPNGNSPN